MTLVSVSFVHIQFINLINTSWWGKKEGKLKHTDKIHYKSQFLKVDTINPVFLCLRAVPYIVGRLAASQATTH